MLVLLVVIGLVGIAVAAVLYYRRRERLLREQCEGIFAEYMPMDDSGQVPVPLYSPYRNIELS